MPTNPRRRVAGRRAGAIVLAAATLQIAGCRDKAKEPIADYLSDIGGELAAIDSEASTHADEVRSFEAFEVIDALERVHGARIEQHVERIMGDLSAVEVCGDEGSGAAVAWMSELAGGLLAETKAHGTRMRSVTDPGAALDEEVRHRDRTRAFVSAEEEQRIRALGSRPSRPGWRCPIPRPHGLPES